MAKTVNVKLNIDAKNAEKSVDAVTNSIEGLENQLEMMKTELKGLDIGSVEFKKLQSEVTTLDSKLKNATKSIEGMDFDQIAGEAGKFAGGVGAITGAFVLLGDTENKTLQQLQENMNKALGIVMAVKGGIEVATSATKLWVPVQQALNKAMLSNPIALYTAAILACVAAIYLIIRATDQQAKTQREINKAYEQASTEIGTQKRKLDELLTTARDNTATLQERQAAMEEINKISPEFLGNLTLETIGTRGATDAMTLYIEEMANKAKAQALNALLVEKYIKLEEQYNSNDNIQNISKTKDAIYELEKEYKKLVTDVDVFTRVTKGTTTSITDLIGTTQVGVPEGTEAINFDGTPIIYKNGKWEAVVVKPKGNSSTTTKTSVDNWKKAADDTVEITETQFDRMYQAGLDYEARMEQQTQDFIKEQEDIADTNLAIYEDELERKERMRLEYERLTNMNLRDKSKHFLQEMLGLDSEGADLIINEAVNTAGMLIDSVNAVKLAKEQAYFDAKQAQIDDQLERELNATADNEAEQNRIRTKFARTQALLDKEIAEKRQRNAVKQAVIDGASSIAGIWSKYGANPVIAGILTALSVAKITAQLAVINNQKFAAGGLLYGPSHTQGGIQTMFGELEGGEAVINKRATQRYSPILSKINEYGGGKSFDNGSGALIDYKMLGEAIRQNIKTYIVSSEMTNQQYKDTKIIDGATI